MVTSELNALGNTAMDQGGGDKKILTASLWLMGHLARMQTQHDFTFFIMELTSLTWHSAWYT